MLARFGRQFVRGIAVVISHSKVFSFVGRIVNGATKDIDV